MSLKCKRSLPFFILLSILLVNVLTPFFVISDDYAASQERRPGVLVALNSIGGNVCCPESKSETFLRGETRFFFSLGTSFITTLTRSGFMLITVYKLLYKDILHLTHNPVKIAQYFHLGDGMK